MWLPTRTAREYPTIDSHGAPLDISCRSIVPRQWGSAAELSSRSFKSASTAAAICFEAGLVVELLLQSLQNHPSRSGSIVAVQRVLLTSASSTFRSSGARRRSFGFCAPVCVCYRNCRLPSSNLYATQFCISLIRHSATTRRSEILTRDPGTGHPHLKLASLPADASYRVSPGAPLPGPSSGTPSRKSMLRLTVPDRVF